MTVRQFNHGYRLYSTRGKNLGTFTTRDAAIQHEKEVQFFKYKSAHPEKFKKGLAAASPQTRYRVASAGGRSKR